MRLALQIVTASRGVGHVQQLEDRLARIATGVRVRVNRDFDYEQQQRHRKADDANCCNARFMSRPQLLEDGSFRKQRLRPSPTT